MEKKKPCFEFRQGQCKYGDFCFYSHSATDFTCRDFRRGQCKYGSNCKYSHDAATVSETSSPSTPELPTENEPSQQQPSTKGSTPAPSDSSPPSNTNSSPSEPRPHQPHRPQICRFFAHSGQCKYQHCKFAHIDPNLTRTLPQPTQIHGPYSNHPHQIFFAPGQRVTVDANTLASVLTSLLQANFRNQSRGRNDRGERRTYDVTPRVMELLHELQVPTRMPPSFYPHPTFQHAPRPFYPQQYHSYPQFPHHQHHQPQHRHYHQRQPPREDKQREEYKEQAQTTENTSTSADSTVETSSTAPFSSFSHDFVFDRSFPNIN